MERCPSWPKEHDWKSRRRQKRLEGSNPSLSAIIFVLLCISQRFFIMIDESIIFVPNSLDIEWRRCYSYNQFE